MSGFIKNKIYLNMYNAINSLTFPYIKQYRVIPAAHISSALPPNTWWDAGSRGGEEEGREGRRDHYNMKRLRDKTNIMLEKLLKDEYMRCGVHYKEKISKINKEKYKMAYYLMSQGQQRQVFQLSCVTEHH